MPKATILVFQNEPDEAPLLQWLNKMEQVDPKSNAKCLARILQLEQAGYDIRRPAADILRDGIWELRAKSGRVQYRILYFWVGKNAACLSHGFTKEGAVPDVEFERAIQARELVTKNRGRYTVEWEL